MVTHLLLLSLAAPSGQRRLRVAGLIETVMCSSHFDPGEGFYTNSCRLTSFFTTLSSHTDVWHWPFRGSLSRQEIELISPVICAGSACRDSSKPEHREWVLQLAVRTGSQK